MHLFNYEYKKISLFVLLCLTSINVCFSKTIFKSEKEIIEFAIKNSNELKMQKSFCIEQMKNAKISIDKFLPKLEFGWSEFDNININNSDNRTKSIDFSMTQLLFDNGASQMEYKYKKYSALLSYYEYKNNLENFCISISEKYYQYILQCNIIKLKKQLLENMEQNLKIVEYEYNNGIALKSDLLEYKISCQEIKNQIAKEENTKKNIILDLKNILNINYDFTILDELNHVSYNKIILIENLSNYEKLIIQNDIQLKQAKATHDFQITQYKISKQFFIPTISLQAGISFSGKTYPLTQPLYSFKIIFSFNNIPFVPSNFSNNENIKSKELNSISNSFSTNIVPQIQYFSNQRLTKISLNQSELQNKQRVEELKKIILQYIQQNDNSIEYISLLKESLKLKEEKFVIS